RNFAQLLYVHSPPSVVPGSMLCPTCPLLGDYCRRVPSQTARTMDRMQLARSGGRCIAGAARRPLASDGRPSATAHTRDCETITDRRVEAARRYSPCLDGEEARISSSALLDGGRVRRPSARDGRRRGQALNVV